MLKQRMTVERAQGIVNEFNSLIENGRLQGYMRLLHDKNNYMLVMGNPEQFAYEVYQCKLCQGTLEECYKTALAVKLAIEVEFHFY